jgi:hypothetical protein
MPVNQEPAPASPPAPVWWVAWFVIQVGNGLSHTVLSKSKQPPPEVSISQDLWFLALAPLLVSMFIRFRLLPKQAGTPNGLALAVAGAGLCEMSLMLGHLLFHPHMKTFGILTAMGVAMYVPVYLSGRR